MKTPTMKLLPRSVTVAGLVMAVASVLMDDTISPLLVDLVGPHAGTKLAALGALVASLGRALFPPADEAPKS